MPPALLRRLPLVLLVLAAIGGAILFRDALSFEALRDSRAALLAFRDQAYPLAMLAFVAAYAVVVALSLPGGTVATLTGGFLFGLFPGTLLNVTGATLGATILFLAVRSGLGAGLARRLDQSSGPVLRVKQGIDRNQWSMLFLIRLLPIIPFFVANLLPALLDVPLRRYVISTFLGIIPGALVFTSVGAGLGTVFDQGATPDLGVIFTPPVLLPLLGLAALSALPILLNLRRKG
jgi:uncharacterized membrane protein YdjX (TVP38/TMEM64 family)